MGFKREQIPCSINSRAEAIQYAEQDWKRVGAFSGFSRAYFGKLDTQQSPFIITPTVVHVERCRTCVSFRGPWCTVAPHIRGTPKKDHAFDNPKLLNPYSLNYRNPAFT